jgi:hypothetical protein
MLITEKTPQIDDLATRYRLEVFVTETPSLSAETGCPILLWNFDVVRRVVLPPALQSSNGPILRVEGMKIGFSPGSPSSIPSLSLCSSPSTLMTLVGSIYCQQVLSIRRYLPGTPPSLIVYYNTRLWSTPA